MLTITIETAKGDPIQFDWDATSEEFQHLYNSLEELAADQGINPRDIATKAIHMMGTKGELDDMVKRRDQGAWVVYAVLRYVEENVDLANMVDLAGVITGPPTIFDLAAHQHVKAGMRIVGDAIEMDLIGRSPLDS